MSRIIKAPRVQLVSPVRSGSSQDAPDVSGLPDASSAVPLDQDPGGVVQQPARAAGAGEGAAAPSEEACPDFGSPVSVNPAAAVLEAAAVLARAKEAAERLLQEARSEAQAIVEGARADAERLHKEAVESGRREGYEAGVQQGLEALDAALAQVERMAREAIRLRDEALSHCEEDALKLALAIAERLVQERLTVDSEVVRRNVQAALRRSGDRDPLVIRLHPQDLEALSAERERIDELAGRRGLQWVDDPRVGRGGCVIETAYGAIDGRIEARLCGIGRALLDVMRGAE